MAGPISKSWTPETILTAWPYAHRGLHTDDQIVPENSLLAFSHAIEQGYAIEMDVHLSADEEVMVFHDENLYRMTGIDKKLSEVDSEEIRELSLLASRERVPFLEETLSLVDGQVPLLIEIKNKGQVGQLEKNLLAILRNYSGPYAIQSFNPLTVGYFKKHAPEIIRGQLSSSFAGEKLPAYKKFILKYLLLNPMGRPHFVAYQSGCLPDWLARILKRRGILILIWTVRSQEEVERLPVYIDNIIFELFPAQTPWRLK